MLKRPPSIAVLDISSSKISALVTTADGSSAPKGTRIGHAVKVPRGMHAGAITQYEEARTALRDVLRQAIRHSGQRPSALYVSLSQPQGEVWERILDSLGVPLAGAWPEAVATYHAIADAQPLPEGAIVISLGAELTQIASRGPLGPGAHPPLMLGGAHITRDIAKVLEISLENAERIKTLYGYAQPLPADAPRTAPIFIDDMRAQTRGRGTAALAAPRSVSPDFLHQIIHARATELAEHLARALNAGHGALEGETAREIFLTGGGALLPGIASVIGEATHLPTHTVVLPRPPGLESWPELGLFTPLFGLLRLARSAPLPQHASAIGGSRLDRAWRWLRDNV